MWVVGNCEYGLLFYRQPPKFRNGGRMIFNCIDGRGTRSHRDPPTQKERSVVGFLYRRSLTPATWLLTHVPGGTTLLAAERLGRPSYGLS